MSAVDDFETGADYLAASSRTWRENKSKSLREAGDYLFQARQHLRFRALKLTHDQNWLDLMGQSPGTADDLKQAANSLWSTVEQMKRAETELLVIAERLRTTQEASELEVPGAGASVGRTTCSPVGPAASPE